jgi:hypothetical protein
MENVNQTQVDETVNEEVTSEETVKTPEVKTFTQEELDKIVADRIARERKKLEKFADYDDLKAKAAEYERQLEEKRLAEMSEKERAEELAKKYEAEKLQLAQELETLRESIKQEKINAEFIRVATSHNIAYIDDAFRLADLAAVKIDDDGKVVGMEEVVKALVEHKPFLLGSKKTPQTIGGPTIHDNDSTKKTAEQLLQEAADKARKSGKPEDVAAFSKLKRELGL